MTNKKTIIVLSTDLPATRTIPEHLHQIYEALPDEERQDLARVDSNTRDSILEMRATAAANPIVHHAKAQAAVTHNAIATKSRNEQLKLWSPFPTELTRSSPFFPMSTQEMSKREYIKDMIIADHSWGQVRFTGEKLSVFDEDMLMILLAAINEMKHSRVDDYTYTGPLSHLLKLKGINNPGANHYEDAYESFKRMMTATFELNSSSKSSPRTQKREKSTVNNIISNLSYDRPSGSFSATVNPYFYEMYLRGEVTWMDIEVRTKLKSPVAKALFRFVQSHRADHWTGPVPLMSASLNIDLNLPTNKQRDRIRKAIAELVEFAILQPSCSVVGDTVNLYRVPRNVDQKQLGSKRPTADKKA